MTRTISFLRMMAAVLLATAAVVAATGMGTVSAQQDVDLQELLDNSDHYLEQEITVTGQVDDILTAAAFRLSSEDADGTLLVSATPETIPIELSDDAQVEVTGTLELFDTADPADWDSGIDPNSGVFAEYANEPILVADSITVTSDGGQGQQGQQDQQGLLMTISEILNDADAAAGNSVRVNGTVNDVLDDQSLTITSDDTDGDLLIVGSSNMMPSNLTEDALVQVQGTVEIFDLDDPGFWEDRGIDANNDLYTEYDQQPVILANSVRMVAPALGELVDNILEDTDTYVDTQVTVLGRIADELNDNDQAFELDGTEGFLGLTETNLLVVGAQNMMPDNLSDDAIVQVQGTVEVFDPDNWGEEGIGIDPTDDFFSDYDGDPVLVADSVTVLANDPGSTVEEILDDTDAFVGEQVTVAGTIEDVLEDNDQAFTLEGTEGFLGLTEDNLRVVGASDMMPRALVDDLVVVVTGTVVIFDRDSADEWGADDIDLDVTDGIFDDFDGEPVIVADSIQAIAVD